MYDVPPEIINIIFSNLPVKSLLRFRSVSKSYHGLIDSPTFVKSHLNQSLISNSHQTIVTLNHKNQIHSTNFDSLDKSTLLTQLGTPVLGSCNGLLCLLHNYCNVALYNPWTREKKTLPDIEKTRFRSHVGFRSECDNEVYGFGYDCVNEDYKVVWIRFCSCKLRLDTEFRVYSLKSNSWRMIKDFPYVIELGTKGRLQNVVVNGALHWPVTLTSDSKIVSFNLATEEFGLIPLPMSRNGNFPIKVVELGGKLSVHCNIRRNRVDIWVMSCYGVKESWRKLLTVSQPADISRVVVAVQAVAYSLDGQRVLLEHGNGKLCWYDLQLKRVWNIRIPGLKNISSTHIFVGSLVKLNGAAKTDVL